MRRYSYKLYRIFFCILICILLTGCKVGKYSILEFYADENGNQHFMLFGERGSSGEVEDIDSDITSSESVKTEDEVLSESTENMQDDGNLEDIVGRSLKRGWTSSDHSILRGSGVSVKEDSILFSVDLGKDKEVTISYNIILDDGEYQIVYISPDGTERVLQDSEMLQTEENILFTQGKNEIKILSNGALFKKINIAIAGIEVSDFE